MRLFRQPTIDDLKNRGFLLYTKFGLNKSPADSVRESFPSVEVELKNTWITDFKKIEIELTRHYSQSLNDNKVIMDQLKSRFPFLNRRSCKRIEFLLWYSRLRG